MVSTQIQLSEAQMQALKTLAEAQNKSAADLIRDAIDAFLRAGGSVPKKLLDEERKRRAIAAIGRFSSGLADLATNHDRYLADAFSQ
jgi:predicted transcriptional regulator